MDHAANDVLKPVVIKCPRTNPPFLELVCHAKRPHHPVQRPDTPRPADHHRHGLPILRSAQHPHVLEDQYPDPPLCFDTPERRVIVRMAVDQDRRRPLRREPDSQHPTFLALAQELAHQCFVMDR